MYEIARSQAERPLKVLARVVDTRGFSSRFGSEAAAIRADGELIGSVLGGTADDAIRQEALGPLPRLVAVRVSDADADSFGLSCGGSARVLLQDPSQLPPEAWTLLAAREPACLVTSLAAADLGQTEVFVAATIADAERVHPGAARLFARGARISSVLDDVLVSALWPDRHLVVVGDGLIAEALTTLATQLGWTSAVLSSAESAAVAADTLSTPDAVVVLSHDRAVDGPALASALAGRAGYVGALGSRHTQAARAEWLSEHEVDADTQARIHGPAGLDIGAFTPVEIAVSIVAEILAVRAGSAAAPLSTRTGPIHLDGVNAPPPRY